MDTTALRTWLTEHADDISRFTEYEPIPSEDADLAHNLGNFWFRAPDWNQPGYRFTSLGQDGRGSEFALWLEPRAGSQSPVVFFGSEGGAGVLAPSPITFVQALAHGARVREYQHGDLDAPSRLTLEENWMIADASGQSAQRQERVAAARAALDRYRAAVEAQFGALPAFELLVDVEPSFQAEFRRWVTGVQERVLQRDRQAQQEAAARKHQDLRDKATRYAATGSPPPSSIELEDGHKYPGSCGACGRTQLLRLTRYEELVFGICTGCYFSKAW